MKSIFHMFRNDNHKQRGLGPDNVEVGLVIGFGTVLAGALAPVIGRTMVENGWWKFQISPIPILFIAVFAFVGIAVFFWFKSEKN